MGVLRGEIRLKKRIKNKKGEQTKLSQFREILKLWGRGGAIRGQCTHSSIESRLHIYILLMMQLLIIIILKSNYSLWIMGQGSS